VEKRINIEVYKIMSEASNSAVEALIGLVRAQLLDVNTAIPGVIIAYSGGLARVLPIGKKRFADGDLLDYPIIPNVRVCWPSFSGGAAGVKGPIKPGDKCLLVFSQQAIDDSDDRRMFDLQDAYAVMCDIGNAGQGDSGNNEDMTMFFGPAYIRITASGELDINAPGGTTINTPSTRNTGTLTTEGLLTYQNGMSGLGGANGTTMQGNLNHTSGTITSLGKRIDGTHTHGGVQPGAGNTGAPNA
jgi:hypothetical protein